jgi:Ca2+-binding RTX toxin-like protein
MYGGAGNDIFYVDNLADVVYETGSGSDTVRSTVSFDLNAVGSSVVGSIENLRLNGTAVTGTGNSLNNVIFGNDSANRLYGNGGKDVITGGGGNDTMTGGSGSDTFCRHGLASEGKDTITDFKIGRGGDVLDIDSVLTGYKSATSSVNDFVRLTESGGNTTVHIDANGALGGYSFTSAVVLAGVTGTSVNQLFNNGNLDFA